MGIKNLKIVQRLLRCNYGVGCFNQKKSFTPVLKENKLYKVDIPKDTRNRGYQYTKKRYGRYK